MRVRRIAVLSLAVLAGLGCGGESSAAALKGPLDYQRSGGLAGLREHLTIQPSGQARLVSGRLAHRRSFRLTAAERRRVEAAVRAADLGTVKVRKHAAVPDAFIYSLAYGGRTLRFDDPSAPRRVRGLVTELNRLVTRHR